MQDRIKGLMAGILIGSLATGTAVYAAGGTMIDVFYNINDLKINRVSKMPSGDQKPFTYNGTTYVPLRFVAENLGLPVHWDGKTGTIYIGEMEAANEVYPGRYLYPSFSKGSVMRTVYDGEEIEDANSNVYKNYISS